MGKHTIEIKIYVSEIIYDVQQKVFHIGESMYDGKNKEQVAKVEELTDDALDIVLRSLGQSYGVIREKMHEYLDEDYHYADNILLPETRKRIVEDLVFTSHGKPVFQEQEESTLLTFSLRMPKNFSTSARDGIASAIHDYMVGQAITEWLLVTPARDMAQVYAKNSETPLLLLDECLNRRERPRRTHLPEEEEPHTTDIRYE